MEEVIEKIKKGDFIMRKIVLILLILICALSACAPSLDKQLADAIKHKDRKPVELLISKGADVNAQDNIGITPLHFACEEGHKDIAELLISKDADVNVKDEDGRTPLSMAKTEEIKALLRKHGAK